MSMPFPIASDEDFKRLVENPLFHQLLDALRLAGRVILTVTFQKVDAAPNTQGTAEAHNDGPATTSMGLIRPRAS